MHTENRTILKDRCYNLGFVMEQTLGHVTHDRNLSQWVAEDSRVAPVRLPIPYEADDLYQRLPLVKNNWTLKASLRARKQLRAALSQQKLDGLFFHTQVTALFSTALMQKIPTIVSLDATPKNVDSVGAAYNHTPSSNMRLEAWKNQKNRRTFLSARHLITWCDWAKQSLVTDYGIAADKITVIPPGIDLAKWRFERKPRPTNAPVRLLFVGGDFRRKGGDLLLRVFRDTLAKSNVSCELDIVTREEVNTTGLTGVRVHHGLNSNAPELMRLYAEADAFVFPTRGDCLPIAVMEAMASGLPVLATRVGAICEEVEEGETGFLVPPDDVNALAAAAQNLVQDGALRQRMGQAGRERAEAHFDGARNYRAVIAHIKRCVDGTP
jgi:glycosyltransferase involved in cell wall biosynthesis